MLGLNVGHWVVALCAAFILALFWSKPLIDLFVDKPPVVQWVEYGTIETHAYPGQQITLWAKTIKYRDDCTPDGFRQVLFPDGEFRSYELWPGRNIPDEEREPIHLDEIEYSEGPTILPQDIEPGTWVGIRSMSIQYCRDGTHQYPSPWTYIQIVPR